MNLLSGAWPTVQPRKTKTMANINFHPDGVPAITIASFGDEGRFELAALEVQHGPCAHGSSRAELVYAALLFVKREGSDNEFVPVEPCDEFDAERRAFSAYSHPDLTARLAGGIWLANGLAARTTMPYPPDYHLTGPGAASFSDNLRWATDQGFLQPTSPVWPALSPRWADFIDRRLRGELSGDLRHGIPLISAAPGQTTSKGDTRHVH